MIGALWESNNQLPDVLDEAKWSLDFLLKMQSNDGGVFFKVATTGYPPVLQHEDLEQYYVSAKTTHITAMFAAVMAKASRIYKDCFPEFADTCLVRAELAWQFLESHPQATPPFGYIDDELGSDLSCGQAPDDGDFDERAWAAVELYRATEADNYHTAFKNNWSQNDPFFGWSRTVHSQKRASRSYLKIDDLPVDGTVQAAILEAMINDADEIVDRAAQNPYRGEYRSDHRPFIGWGNYNQSTNHAATLLKAYFATGNDTYLYHAKLNLDPQFGNNPLSRSFVTGLGDNPSYKPHPFSLSTGWN